MALTCNQPLCTVSQTNLCMFNHPVESCPYRMAPAGTAPQDQQQESTEPKAVEPDLLPSLRLASDFPPSFSLGLDDLPTLTKKSYHRMIGIFGPPNAGKTALLVSLYLMLSHSSLEGYSFADSLTLREFDDISRNARQWANGAPEQMTAHTELSDARNAGFMHLRLKQSNTDNLFNLLFPDLPGEWSDTLIDKNRTDRLQFLKGADAIWVLIDGRQLLEPTKKINVLRRTKILIDRFAAFLKENSPPLSIVITHRDVAPPPDTSLVTLEEECKSYPAAVKIFEIASFSHDPAIKPGFGISQLLEHVLSTPKILKQNLWDTTSSLKAEREFLNFGCQSEES